MRLYSREETKRFLRERVARPASSGVIITNTNDEVLVLKAHYKPYWSFPGGWIENNQTPILAALRELEEETGIILPEEDLTFAFMVNRTSEIMQSYQFIFQTQTKLFNGDAIILQASEIAEYKFVSRDDVLRDKNQYGGAVVVWAEGTDRGYYEKELNLGWYNKGNREV